jgi:hypothetical protein
MVKHSRSGDTNGTGSRSAKMTISARRTVLAGMAAMILAACTPTIRVEVAPINIYAKLDADVRIRLDKEVQSAIAQNPNLF